MGSNQPQSAALGCKMCCKSSVAANDGTIDNRMLENSRVSDRRAMSYSYEQASAPSKGPRNKPSNSTQAATNLNVSGSATLFGTSTVRDNVKNALSLTEQEFTNRAHASKLLDGALEAGHEYSNYKSNQNSGSDLKPQHQVQIEINSNPASMEVYKEQL